MRIIVTDSSQRARLDNLLSQAGCQGAVVVDIADADQSTGNIHNRLLSPNDPAYVLFSSGTTGTPKGIVVSHYAVHTYCQGANALYQARKDDKWVRAAAYTFDSSIDEMFCPLAVGAEMIIQPAGALTSFLHYSQFLKDTDATILTMTTALWHTFARYILQEQQSLPPKIRIMSIGGEAGLMSIFKAWRATIGKYPKILNGYGPTEATVCTTYWEANDEVDSHVMPIGRPLPGYECYVLDPLTNNPVALGEEGILFVSGSGLAMGYLNNYKLTEQRFVPNRWAKSAEYERMYNTGDLVCVDMDGVYHFRGRADLQVKIRGFRVELEAIEACLLAHPSVTDVAVIAVSEQETHSLHAFVVEASNARPVYTDHLIDHCRKTLADYEVPAHFFRIKKLPYSASQKVDRRALASLSTERFPFANESAGSMDLGDVDSQLVELWHQCLHDLSGTSLHKNSHFIHLGGHSLTFITLAAKIRSTMGISVSTLDLMRNPTLLQMSKLLAACEPSPLSLPPSSSYSETGEFQSNALSISSGPRGTYPLSSAQARLYTVQQNSPDSPVLNDGLALKIDGLVSHGHMRIAIQSIVCRHDILRVRLALDDQAKVYQEVLPFDEALFDRIFTQETLPQSEVVRHVSEIYLKAFDLFEPPLIQIALLSSGELEHVLVVCAHHIIWDGFSDRIFTDELSALYQCKNVSPAVNYIDCCCSFQRKPDADRLSSLVSYLSSVPQLLELPIDFVRPDTQTFNHGGNVHFEVDHRAVSDLTRRLGSTPYSCLMTAFSATLHLCAARQEDFTVGVPFANRSSVEAANAIGFFINTLPLRVKFADVGTLDNLHAAIQNDLLFLTGLQDVPFDSVVSSLGMSRFTSRDSLLQVILNYTDAPEGKLDAHTTFSRFPVSNGAAHTDLICFVELSKDGTMLGELEYDSGIFAHETMKSLAAAFNCILVAWSAEPTQTIDGLTFGESSAHVPSVSSPDPADSSFGAFLASRAVGFSERQAVYDDTTGTSYTYRELYSMAKRVQERVRPFKRTQGMVLLLLERTIDVVAAEIGVSLAGLPWVPCNIFQPLSRIREITEDVSPVCVLAHRQVLERLGASARDLSAPVLFVDALFDDLESVGPEDIIADDAANVAYVIYTSGSTGKPKGIAIGHCSIIGMLREVISWTEGRKMSYNGVSTSNIAWDATFVNFYPSLATGGCVKLPKFNGEKDGEYLSRLMMVAPPVNSMFATSAAIRMWLDQTAEQTASFFPDGFHHILIGGDEVLPGFVRRVFDALAGSPAARIQQIYGPTEGTVFSSYGVLTRRDLNTLTQLRRTPLDRLLPQAAMTVANPHGNELPRGFVGEIVIWGPCLLLEYKNQPELNRQRFLVKNGIRGWRSGDLGRHLPCGKFEIFGRLDSMCKVKGGFRVELGEIDAQIRTHPQVKDCYVSLANALTSNGETPIVAHVVFSPCADRGIQPSATIEETGPPRELLVTTSPSKLVVAQDMLTSLYRHLSNRIPTYMIPDYVVPIDFLPLSASIKIDKTKLPVASPTERFAIPSDDISSEDEVRGPTVEAILTIFSTVLSIDRQLLPRDNFYHYGGHSLLATRVTSLIRRKLDVPLPFTAIITNPTASELGRFVDSLKEESGRRVHLPPHIIPLQPSGFIRHPKAIMFAFHFIGGDLDMLPRVVNQLDNENLGIATYGVGWEPGRNLNSYDKLADAYAESISAIAGSLPCFLIGWCYGGIIATRVSQRLPQATTHVILIDVPHPGEMYNFHMEAADYAKAFATYLSKVWFGPRLKPENTEKVIQMILEVKPDWHDTAALVALARAHGDLPPWVTDADLRRHLYPLADSHDIMFEIYGAGRSFEVDRRDMEARVVLHLQATDGANNIFPGIPAGLGWERYEILEDTDHDTIGYMPAAQARFLAVVREVLLK